MRSILAFILIAISGPALAQDDLTELYTSLKPSVVTIMTRNADRLRGEIGSGVVVDLDGHIMTAAHVVQTADEIMVRFADGLVIPAAIVVSNTTADLALLQLSRIPKGLITATLGNSDNAIVGKRVFIIGAPFGLNHSLSAGYISGRIDKEWLAGGELLQLLQTDAAVNQGNSGGPMFNSDGKVVGIVSSILSKSGGFEGIGFAVAINVAKKTLLGGPSFWTGFDAVFLGREFSTILNVPSGGGLLVQHVAENSMAGRAGLRAGTTVARLFNRDFMLGGDVILSIHGSSCSQPHDFSRIRQDLEQLRDGEPFVIEVLRAGKRIELTGVVDRAALRSL